MAVPTLGLTFEDYILRVAEHLGIEDATGDTVAIPTDASDLEVCKRIVNDGWRRFFNSKARWNWMQPEFSITFNPDGDNDAGASAIVNGEDHRYYMPDGFYGSVAGDVAYDGDGPQIGIELKNVSESHIRSLFSANGSTTGIPVLVAFRPLSDEEGRWEMLVWPRPSGSWTVLGTIRIYPNKLTELTQRPNAGYPFDDAILASCLYEAERQREEGGDGVRQAEYMEALTRAIAIDNATAPKNLGYAGDPAVSGGRYRRPWYQGVDVYGGTIANDGSITGGTTL